MVVGLGKLTLITFLRPRDKLYGSRPYTGISTLPAQLFSLSCMYQSLVLPTLDYCSSLWDPHYTIYINKLIETVQKFAAMQDGN